MLNKLIFGRLQKHMNATYPKMGRHNRKIINYAWRKDRFFKTNLEKARNNANDWNSLYSYIYICIKICLEIVKMMSLTLLNNYKITLFIFQAVSAGQ